jgi:hypothetical protein
MTHILQQTQNTFSAWVVLNLQIDALFGKHRRIVNQERCNNWDYNNKHDTAALYDLIFGRLFGAILAAREKAQESIKRLHGVYRNTSCERIDIKKS